MEWNHGSIIPSSAGSSERHCMQQRSAGRCSRRHATWRHFLHGPPGVGASFQRNPVDDATRNATQRNATEPLQSSPVQDAGGAGEPEPRPPPFSSVSLARHRCERRQIPIRSRERARIMSMSAWRALLTNSAIDHDDCYTNTIAFFQFRYQEVIMACDVRFLPCPAVDSTRQVSTHTSTPWLLQHHSIPSNQCYSYITCCQYSNNTQCSDCVCDSAVAVPCHLQRERDGCTQGNW